MRSMWRRRLVRSSRARASEAPASFGFGWTSAAGRAVVVAISSPSSARRDLPSLRFVVSAPYGIAAWRASVCDRWYSRRRPFGGAGRKYAGGVSTAGGFWARRMRWRLLGAWRWPLFLAVTVLDAFVVVWLPPNGTSALFVPALVICSFG